MARINPQNRRGAAVWALARQQHGQVERGQLTALGYSDEAIEHRIARGRLHRTRPRVYSVGRRVETRKGEWMAAVLTCGPGAALSHGSAAALWEVSEERGRAIHVTVPTRREVRQPSLVAHRRSTLEPGEVTVHDGIPVTTPTRTLIDIAAQLSPRDLEAAVNEADKLDLVDPETLRGEISKRNGVHGASRLRRLLDRSTFLLADSELERRFAPIARRAGLPQPLTQHRLHGFRADFHWPELGLVVETDGLRYHRTPGQQARDRLRDQVLAASGLTVLRFTHSQVRYEARYVQATLRRVARRLASRTEIGDFNPAMGAVNPQDHSPGGA